MNEQQLKRYKLEIEKQRRRASMTLEYRKARKYFIRLFNGHLTPVTVRQGMTYIHDRADEFGCKLQRDLTTVY